MLTTTLWGSLNRGNCVIGKSKLVKSVIMITRLKENSLTPDTRRKVSRSIKVIQGSSDALFVFEFEFELRGLFYGVSVNTPQNSVDWQPF